MKKERVWIFALLILFATLTGATFSRPLPAHLGMVVKNSVGSPSECDRGANCKGSKCESHQRGINECDKILDEKGDYNAIHKRYSQCLEQNCDRHPGCCSKAGRAN
jgi:hypothetical protein